MKMGTAIHLPKLIYITELNFGNLNCGIMCLGHDNTSPAWMVRTLREDGPQSTFGNSCLEAVLQWIRRPHRQGQSTCLDEIFQLRAEHESEGYDLANRISADRARVSDDEGRMLIPGEIEACLETAACGSSKTEVSCFAGWLCLPR